MIFIFISIRFAFFRIIYKEYYEKEFHRVYDVAAGTEFIHTNGNVLYIGANSNNPTVGDVRVTFTKVLPGDVSILAVVNGNTFEKFTAKNGYSMMTLEDGSVSMDEMFANEHSANKTMSWILRLLGINLVAGVLAFAWSLVVIAIAWLFYRPVLGIILLIIAGGLIWFLGKKSKEKKAQIDAKLAAASAAAAPAAAPVPPAAPAAPVPPAAAPAPEYPEPPAPDFSDAPAPPPEFPEGE